MNETPQRSRLAVVLLGTLFAFVSAVLGGVLGGAYVRFVLPRAPDGFSGIAQVLEALMIGALLGLVASLLLLRPLVRRGPSALVRAVGWVAAGAVVAMVVLVLARPERPGSDPPPPLDGAAPKPTAVPGEADG